MNNFQSLDESKRANGEMNKSSPNPTPSLVQPDMPQVSTAPTNQCPPPPRGSPQGSAGAKVNGTIVRIEFSPLV